MKRIVPILVVAALAVAGFYWRAPLMAALGFGDEDGRYLGYVEGETSLIAPPIAGRLVERPTLCRDRTRRLRRRALPLSLPHLAQHEPRLAQPAWP